MHECAIHKHPSLIGEGKTAPNMANGVTIKLTNGMAKAFARGDTTENCENQYKVKGNKAIVTTACTRVASLKDCHHFCDRLYPYSDIPS